MEHHQVPGTLTDLRKSLEGNVADWVIEELDGCIEALLKAPIDKRMVDAGEKMAKELMRISRGEGAVGRTNHCIDLVDAWEASKIVVITDSKNVTPEMALDMEMDAYESERSLWHSQLWIPITTSLPPIHEDPADDERGYVLLLMQHASWRPNTWKTVKGSRVMLEDGWYWADEEGEIIDEDNELITHWMEIPDPPEATIPPRRTS